MDSFSRSKKLKFVGVAFLGVILFFTTNRLFAEDVLIDGRVPGCGDSVVEVGESCDLGNLNGQSCSTLGFTGGVLSCAGSCAFDTSACTISGSGGGGGGGSRTNTSRSLVALEGYAIPFASIFLLVDGAIVASTTADQVGLFRFSARNLSEGTYQFSLYARDQELLQTSTHTFFATPKNRTVIKYEDIILSPTLASTHSALRVGDILSLSGRSLPARPVIVSVKNPFEVSKTYTGTSSVDGSYSFSIDTTGYWRGHHVITAHSIFLGSTTPSSKPLLVLVGDETVLREQEVMGCPTKGDLNKDCKVNLVDFSIMVFWFHQPISLEVQQLEAERLSGDGKFTITDLSIMLHYWTG